jgi:hypothetical protein
VRVVLAQLRDLFQLVADYQELSLYEDLVLLRFDLTGLCVVQFVDVCPQVSDYRPAVI